MVAFVHERRLHVSVDDKDRTFPEKMYRFPMPSGELNSNNLVDQYPEWK